MKKGLQHKIGFLVLSFSLYTPLTYADQTIINNNYSSAPATNPSPPTNSNSNASQSYGTGLPPGTYSRENPDGSSDEIYTTGDKQPYQIDNGNNSSPPIQPYVYVQPPFGGGPQPGPQPRQNGDYGSQNVGGRR